jgi:two-component system, chemotaxis family, sensor kinase CheA
MPQFDDPDMQEIFEGFLVETQELLDSVSQDLMTLENEPENDDLLNQIFRSFHTIKGTTSFMGFDDITEITHHAEDILNKLRRHEQTVSLEIIDILLEVHDWIKTLVDNLMSDEPEKMDYSSTIAELERLKDPNAAPKATVADNDKVVIEKVEEITVEIKESPTPEDTLQDKPKISAVDSVLANQDMISKPGDFTDDELSLLEEAFAEVNQQFFDEQNAKKESPETKDVVTPEEKATTPKPEEPINEKPAEPKPAPDQPKAKPAPKKIVPKTGETIRIDVERVETLMDLSGELVLGRNRLAQLTENFEETDANKDLARDLSETTASIDFVTSEIQAAVMRMRMVPVGKLYQKAPRIVRDLSKEFKKKIKLVVKGEETEIDRGIIEELNDPLVHMIRNSCDHGLEHEDERVQKGKPSIGTITLDADQEGNNIVLKISDDGAGMDPEKLKEKAIEKGVLTEDQAAQMTDREALQLIFMPGFSTAKKVSNVSGRGVGMDVVRTNIQNLKGMIEIESEVDKGSTFIIKLPLTLAIIQGLLVRILDETYAIPLSSVIEVVAVNPKSVYSVNQQEVIRIRDDVNPLIRLDKTLGVPGAQDELGNRYVVIVGLGIEKVGLVVDELLGQQEIVIKSLGEYLGSIAGIAGSTIMGDGRVIMIIDVVELINTAAQKRNASMKKY